METPQATPVANTVAETCRRTSLGRTTIYELIKSGELRVVKFGARTLVPETELQRLISGRMAAADRQGGAQ